MRSGLLLLLVNIFFITFLVGCDNSSLNNPHQNENYSASIYYSSFSERPKTLDPARSYSTNEALFTAQIYEPPLQYHYLKRPYTLEPLAAVKMPTVYFIDKNGKRLPSLAVEKEIAYSIYEIEIKPGIYFQPHPAFAKDAQGNYLYHDLKKQNLEKIRDLDDFEFKGRRELVANDYVYQVKRLADPRLRSPIFGLMSAYIDGLHEYGDLLSEEQKNFFKKNLGNNFFDFRKYSLAGVKVLDRYRYQIKIKGIYPQFRYWLAMVFFAPVPWEVDRFYSQPGMHEKNLTLDWYPVGTGPYMLTENNPNRQMVLEKNPNFHGELYPHEGAEGDKEKGFLNDAEKPLPFVDKFIFSLEKETIPRWNKFLQGYYDASAISSDSFDQAIQIDPDGRPQLTPTMKEQNIQLQTSIGTSVFYLGFNMLDDIVGGYNERARKLRQAISIALDYEEFIGIFLNGRGIVAQGPIPPGVFGHVSGEMGIDNYVFHWMNGKAKRKSIQTAKKLLAEAGYPDGRDIKTGAPLILHFDTPGSTAPDDKARFDWMRKQFAKLNIGLNVRSTQYNRFQEKMRTGKAQLFFWGWSADYPDPENFLFLLYGANGKVKHGGENAANYKNKKYDELFEAMKHLPNGDERQNIINNMLAIARRDVPWVWGFYPKNFQLHHYWLTPIKPNEMANNLLKYTKLDPGLRHEKRFIWNQAIFWPLIILIALLLGIILPVVIRYWRSEYKNNRN